MLREIVFMLSGKPGALFVLDQNKDFEICPGIPGLSPSEKQILKPLLKIASNYRKIMRFVSEKLPQSLYLSAAKTGIRDSVKPYENLLLEIEKRIVFEGQQLSGITGIYSEISKYEILLSAVLDLVKDLQSDVKLGCTVLDIINRHRTTGIYSVNFVLDQIWDKCAAVLKKQLISFLLFGKLLDPHSEFFIVRSENEKSEKFEKYAINPEFLPVSVLEVSLAQKALFVGESVIVLRESSDLSSDNFSLMAVMKETENSDFEKIIEKSAKFVTERLWTLITADDKLNRELNVLNDFLLMKRGEVFSQFVCQASQLLDSHVGGQLKTLQFGLEQKFRNALNACLQEDDPVKNRLTVKINPDLSPDPARREDELGWNRITLEHKVPWPLDILVFTPEVLKTYNEVFRLLLKLRRVQMNLQKLWLNEPSWLSEPSEPNKEFLQLRWNLQHLFIHLSQYLYTDVIEVQKSLLEKSLKSCSDFETFRTNHAVFLSTVVSQTFIHVAPVQDCIQSLMAVGLQLCRALEGEVEDAEAFRREVERLSDEFRRQMSLFLALLAATQRQSSSSVLAPLAQLLLRLDFNNFFAKSNAVV